MLLLLYVLYMIFQLKTHAYMYENTEEEVRQVLDRNGGIPIYWYCCRRRNNEKPRRPRQSELR